MSEVSRFVEIKEGRPQTYGKSMNFERARKYCRKQLSHEKLEENKARFYQNDKEFYKSRSKEDLYIKS